MSTLADRNNNPLNIRDTNIPWQGAGEPNGGFETFSHAEYGVRAAAKNLYTYNERDGLNTVGGIISQWGRAVLKGRRAGRGRLDRALGRRDDALQRRVERRVRLVHEFYGCAK